MPEREAPVGTGGDGAAVDVGRAEPQLAHEQPQLGARHRLAGGVAQDPRAPRRCGPSRPSWSGAARRPACAPCRGRGRCGRGSRRPGATPSPPPAPLTGPRAETAKGGETVWLPAASVTRSSSVRLPAIAGEAAIVSFLRSGHGRGLVKSQRAFWAVGVASVVLRRDDRRVGGVGHVDDLGAADADVVGRAERHRLVARARAGRQQTLPAVGAAEGGRGVVGDRDARADRARGRRCALAASVQPRRRPPSSRPTSSCRCAVPWRSPRLPSRSASA